MRKSKGSLVIGEFFFKKVILERNPIDQKTNSFIKGKKGYEI